MWRKTACAAAGLVLALAAAYGLTSTQSGAAGPLLDLSFLYQQRSTAKGDRLPVSAIAPASAFAFSFNLPDQNTTVVAKNPSLPAAVSAVRFPRDPVPIYSVKPQEQPDVAQKPKLPEGCEPPFSPVTVPSMAHVAGRCTS
jgi:hypothetical protein